MALMASRPLMAVTFGSTGRNQSLYFMGGHHFLRLYFEPVLLKSGMVQRKPKFKASLTIV